MRIINILFVFLCVLFSVSAYSSSSSYEVFESQNYGFENSSTTSYDGVGVLGVELGPRINSTSYVVYDLLGVKTYHPATGGGGGGASGGGAGCADGYFKDSNGDCVPLVKGESKSLLSEVKPMSLTVLFFVGLVFLFIIAYYRERKKKKSREVVSDESLE